MFRLVDGSWLVHAAFFLVRVSQNSAAPVITTGTNDPAFKNEQPFVVTNAPEPNEVIAMVVNTKKLIAP